MIQESIEDFRKRYKGTFVFLNIEGKEQLVYYEHDEEESFSFWSPVYGDILVDKECAMSRLSFIFPENGLYNIGGTCWEFNRNPARQWKRAPCHENTVFSNPLHLLGVLGRERLSLTSGTAQELFFPSYPNSIEEAIENLKPMVALNLKFGISCSATKDKNKLILWYKNDPIGYANPETKTIEVYVKQLYQEVVDFIKREAWTWSLVNKCQ
jgi:hypothetical protein